MRADHQDAGPAPRGSIAARVNPSAAPGSGAFPATGRPPGGELSAPRTPAEASGARRGGGKTFVAAENRAAAQSARRRV